MLTDILADDKKQGSSLHCEDFCFYPSHIITILKKGENY
jgi:hypothetical protein